MKQILADNQVEVMAKEIKLQVEANHRLRAALLPFAAAAGRPGRLTDSMLADDSMLALGVKVSAWKLAIELTGVELDARKQSTEEGLPA